MSNYYSYYCLDCHASERPNNLNWGDRAMCAVLRHTKELVALRPLAEEVHVCTFRVELGRGHDAPLNFLYEHFGHRLVVLSEYRDHYYLPDGARVEGRVEW